MDFIKYFINTLIVAVMTTVLTVIASATCGYALAKYNYKWINVFLICMLATVTDRNNHESYLYGYLRSWTL